MRVGEESEKAMAPHSSTLLPGKSHGWRSLEGCSPWGCWGSETTERLHFHFSLSCIGEGNGNPLQCSCLENPRDGGAWWAAVSGVAQSRTRLKRLSSSSRRRGIRKKNYRENFGESREVKTVSVAERRGGSGGYICIIINRVWESHILGVFCLLLWCGS